MENNIENEVWRDVDGYDGMYQVSDFGRVRSLKYGKVRVLKGIKNSDGYLSVLLYKDRKHRWFLVHRLVAQAFIENYDESKTIINHINECKSDNRLWNIEWCTPQYNTTYNDIQFRKKNGKRRKIKPLYDPNLSIDENLEVFRANGIECCENTVRRLRKDLGLTNNKRHKLKELYNPNLTYAQNLEIFIANGIECSRDTVRLLRKDLGLTRKYTKRS